MARLLQFADIPARVPVLASVLALIMIHSLHAQAEIFNLNSDDPVYRQHQQLLAEFREEDARGAESELPHVFRYQPDENDTLFSIAGRLLLPYSAIATLNRLTRPTLPEGPLLIPSHPGIFLGHSGLDSWERGIFDRLSAESDGVTLRIPADGTTQAMWFFQGADFSAAERRDFLRTEFVDPLPEGVVSSPYGYRAHPMTGARTFHGGIDVTAPFGTPVTSAAEGVVVDVRRDSWFGLSVRVDHRNGYESRYAHLQETIVSVGDVVSPGATIGFVGSTGFSTGPHLHFEIRRDGMTLDPERYIR